MMHVTSKNLQMCCKGILSCTIYNPLESLFLCIVELVLARIYFYIGLVSVCLGYERDRFSDGLPNGCFMGSFLSFLVSSHLNRDN